MRLGRISAAVAMVALAVLLIGAGGASADELTASSQATATGCTTYTATQPTTAAPVITICAGGGVVTTPGGVQACVVNGSAGAAVVINPGQAESGTASAGAASTPAASATTGDAALTPACDASIPAPNQSTGGAPAQPALTVCSISLPGASGAAPAGQSTAGTIPAGTIVIAGAADQCAGMQTASDATAQPSTGAGCVSFNPSASNGFTITTALPASTTTQPSTAGATAVVIGSIQAIPAAAPGTFQVCTGNTVSLQPITINPGEGCAVGLPGSTTGPSTAGGASTTAPSVVIVTTGQLTCSAGTDTDGASTSPAANATPGASDGANSSSTSTTGPTGSPEAGTGSGGTVVPPSAATPAP